ncbi:melanoma-associated antigen B16-like [Enhydra lutris kenyoni]|uniref:Melanoma-associated antigen B16-like n=1 Tax=Enhydra lutris kenyoni TaxID=391180 RepID=A0A2Y9JR43_ENHLU|nr:melanoma-associated antigen B16-like [Enhydra lutris kenyoni]
MSQGQEIASCTQEQHYDPSKSQGLEATQVSKAMEETSPSSGPLMPGNMEEALAAGIPSAPQSAYSSYPLITAISPGKSGEGSSSLGKDNSSASSSKSLSNIENFPIDPLDEKVTMLVQFLLHKYQMKEPITRADMIDVIQEYNDEFPEILKKASERMELVFGVDMNEVDPTNHSYVLVNKLGLTYDERLGGEDSMPKTSLLIIVLGVIFMKGNCATEEEIWEVLNMMDLYSGRKHFIFGELRKFITQDLVEEECLEYQQVADSDPPCYKFLWGPRAHAETSKMKLLEFLTKIHESDPRCFPSQCEDALRDEAERARARSSSAHSVARSRSSSQPSQPFQH